MMSIWWVCCEYMYHRYSSSRSLLCRFHPQLLNILEHVWAYLSSTSAVLVGPQPRGCGACRAGGRGRIGLPRPGSLSVRWSHLRTATWRRKHVVVVPYGTPEIRFGRVALSVKHHVHVVILCHFMSFNLLWNATLNHSEGYSGRYTTHVGILLERFTVDDVWADCLIQWSGSVKGDWVWTKLQQLKSVWGNNRSLIQATHWLHCPRVAGYACGGIETRSAWIAPAIVCRPIISAYISNASIFPLVKNKVKNVVRIANWSHRSTQLPESLQNASPEPEEHLSMASKLGRIRFIQ